MIRNASRRAESAVQLGHAQVRATVSAKLVLGKAQASSLCGIARPEWSHVSTKGELPSACSVKNTGGSSSPAAHRWRLCECSGSVGALDDFSKPSAPCRDPCRPTVATLDDRARKR